MEAFLYSWSTLLLIGLGLRMAIRLTYGARGPEPGDPIHVFLSTMSWVLITFGLAPVILGGVVTLVGGLFALLVLATVVEIVMQRRTAQRRSMATMIAMLMERGQKLDSSVLLAGQAMRGIVGRAAAQLFAALRRGMPLAPAVAAHPRALPAEAIAYLAAGQTMQSEAAALRELVQSDQGEMATVWRACVDRICYLAFVLTVMLGVLTFIMIKIVPEFEQIFSEFDMYLPVATQVAISFSFFFTQYLAAPIGAGLALFVVSVLALSFCYLCDVAVLRPWGDLLFRRRRTAHVLRILAVATEQRQPLAVVLHRVAYVYPSMPIRSQLAPAAAEVSGGADWRDALLKARVVSRAEHGLLKTAERVGNLPWALRQIARRREKRAVYRLAALLQVVYPVVIVLLGAFVGFYVVSLFAPIAQLIEALA